MAEVAIGICKQGLQFRIGERAFCKGADDPEGSFKIGGGRKSLECFGRQLRPVHRQIQPAVGCEAGKRDCAKVEDRGLPPCALILHGCARPRAGGDWLQASGEARGRR